MKKYLNCANPYLPLWEHCPDTEPRVFDYNGEKRVFVYGSHDTNVTSFCGKDYVTWSAPVGDLTDWTYHGVIYNSVDSSDIYAPDVVKKGDTYYLYSAENHNGTIYVSKSKSPVGPFTDPVLTELGADVGVLVDDDGRVYAYWGHMRAHVAELNEDMATIKKGTHLRNFIPHCPRPGGEDGVIDLKNGFFEASSPRKIMGKYVLVYSKMTCKAHLQYGIEEGERVSSFLSYYYADEPLGKYTFGGDISVNTGELITDDDGKIHRTWESGNNHGGLCEINGEYYIFNHRHTDLTGCARQSVLERVDVALDKNGRLYIGDITYKDGEPVSCRAVENTSQGPHKNGIKADYIISAGYACHIYGKSKRAYVKRVDGTDKISAPVSDITNGASVGFKYLSFGSVSPKTVTVNADVFEDCTVIVRVGNYRGKEIASFQMKKGDTTGTFSCRSVTGKEAVYFCFYGEDGKVLAEFDSFTFNY